MSPPSPSASPSCPNSQSGDGFSMSYYNDAASELGRKLNLGDRGSPADDMRTRSQAKKESQNKSRTAKTRSQAQASSSSRAMGKGKGIVEPTRRQPRRGSSRRTRDPSPDDDDDDDDSEDDDDDDDDDDDEDDDDPNPPQTPRISPEQYRRRIYLAIMSAFEPNMGSLDPASHLSPSEFIKAADGDRPRMNESSQKYLAVVNLQAALVTDIALPRINREVPLNGDFWGTTIAADLRSRAENALRLFKGEGTGTGRSQRDAVETVRELRRIFDAAAAVFREWPLNLMQVSSKTDIAYRLTWILHRILMTHEDVSRGAQSRAVYAGMPDAYNLFDRFKSTRDDWSHFLTVLWQLHMNPTPFNDEARQLLSHSCQLLDWHHSSSRINNNSALDFMARFKAVAQAILGAPV